MLIRLRNWWRRSHDPVKVSRERSFSRPDLEQLESRTVLSGGLSARLTTNGVLLIRGTTDDDYVQVRKFGNRIEIDGVSQSFSAPSIRRLDIRTFAGNDTIDLRAEGNQRILTKMTVIYAGTGDDLVFGGQGTDFIYGQDGADDLNGQGSADKIWGGPGDDLISGQGGNDQLFGGADTDILDGGAGANDWLEAGSPDEDAINGWNAHRWVLDETSYQDVDQQYAPTCSLLATLASAARRGFNLESQIQYRGNFTYSVRLFDQITNRWTSRNVFFDGSMVRAGNGRIVDPRVTAEDEFWTVLYQRAYVRFRGMDPMNGDQVSSFGGDELDNPLTMIVGKRAITRATAFSSPALLQNKLNAGNALVTGSKWTATNPFVVGGHAYMVEDVVLRQGRWFVKLFNPWGFDGRRSQGPNDGFIVLDWATYRSNYEDWAFATV
ncbi:MAG: C2 family cysteine protease [Gemmataceae bacterium]